MVLCVALYRYHDAHYFPGNAIVYLVGDLPTSQMLAQLSQVSALLFEHGKAGAGRVHTSGASSLPDISRSGMGGLFDLLC